jgi:hypothetical protein
VWTVNSSEMLATVFCGPEVTAIITDHAPATMRLRD